MRLQNKYGAGLTAVVLVTGSILGADGLRFSDFTPLTGSAGPTATEATPITFGNPVFQQRSVAERNSQIAAGYPNTGVWDMTTVNETRLTKAATSSPSSSRPSQACSGTTWSWERARPCGTVWPTARSCASTRASGRRGAP